MNKNKKNKTKNIIWIQIVLCLVFTNDEDNQLTGKLCQLRSEKCDSHQEPILRPQAVVCDFGLRGQVWGGVVVGRDELGVLVFVQLVRSGLQHSLLQLDAPLELHVAKRPERHEEAEQPVLRGGGGAASLRDSTDHQWGRGVKLRTCRMTVFLSDGGCSPRMRAVSSSF